MAGSFVHLHTHTDHSLLDGASTIAEVVQKAVDDGQPALAITDHGTLSGVPDFFRRCNAAGIKPIAGSELYHTTGDMHTSSGETHHLTAVATDQAGYRNLVQLSSRSHLDGFYRKPRVDWALLAEHNQGLIVTSGCLGGMLPQAIVRGDMTAARTIASRYQEIFGRENFFLELQFHGLPEQRLVNQALIAMSDDLGAPLVVTNDSHYTDADQHHTHDALLCVQTGAKLTDQDRFRFDGDQYWLKTAAEMRQLWHRLPEACDNTLAIAERCDLDLGIGQTHLPNFSVPEPHQSAADYLRALTLDGAHDRWGSALPDKVADRINYELTVIDNMGFSSYFLITADLVRHARQSAIEVGPGRGSAAGCAVAYALGITQVDPVEHDLVFERFLNPQRVSMPDIDLDFGSERRDELLAYATETYGEDCVAQITTFQMIQARSAVRDSARVLDVPYGIADRLAKAVPEPVAGRHTPLAHCLNEHSGSERTFRNSTELRRLILQDNGASKTIALATQLEGRIRAAGAHPAAIVIADSDLSQHVPLLRRKGASLPATQYGVDDLEALGYLKMDLLGLKVLDVLGVAADRVEDRTGARPDLTAAPMADPATFDLLASGNSVGVFQLESLGIQALLRAMNPQSYEDVAAVLALYRPGPMAAEMHHDYIARKNGTTSAEAFHPDAEDILGPTHGLCIYQEQLMRLAERFAGYTPGEADLLRKAMGKKDRGLLDSHQETFVQGCLANGYQRDVAERLFATMRPFADYAFNKSHSYAYGLISLQTAYLKANWPAEFMASQLHAHRRDTTKARQYLRECQRLGLAIAPPTINSAAADPTVSAAGDTITIGLASVKDVGDLAATTIITERIAGGPYPDLADFCRRHPQLPGRAKAIEALVNAGAFDTNAGPSRRHLLANLDSTLNSTRKSRPPMAGTQTLFDPDETALAATGPTCREFSSKKLAQLELSSLGVSLSETLAARLHEAKRLSPSQSLAEIASSSRAAAPALVAITDVKKKTTRRGEDMAVMTVEDLSGEATVVVFPDTYSAIAPDLLKPGSVVVLTASADEASEQLIAHGIDQAGQHSVTQAVVHQAEAIGL